MTGTGPVPGTTAGADRLTGTVAELLARRLGRPVRLAGLSRSASPFASRAQAEVVTAALASGRSYRLFLKRWGDEEPDHPDKRRRDRELCVYRDLFAGRELPVPLWLGGGWNPAVERHDLYLEHIEDWDLRYQELRYWYIAADRLGRLHRAFASGGHELAAHAFLLRLDAGYFDGWAERGMAALRGQSRRLARRYERVLSAFGKAVGPLATAPATLVHNDLSAKNVLVDRAPCPPRICLVDWELAGVGCGLLDLSHLTYGLPPAEAARLRARYYRAVRGSGLLPYAASSVLALLAACRIHETNVRLWCAPRWSLPDGTLATWVGEAEAMARRLS